MTVALQSLFSGLAVGSVFAIVGLGFVVIHRVTNVVNFAQGAMAVGGAFLMSSLVGGWGWVPAAIVSVAFGAALGALVGLPVVAGRRPPGVAALIVTLGAAIVLQGAYILVWGEAPVSYDPVAHTAIRVGGAFILPQQIVTFAAMLAVFAALQAFFARSYLGKALTAAADNPAAARLVGVSLSAMGVIAFAVSGGVSALGALLVAPLDPVTPETQLELAVEGFTAAVIGNLHSPLRTLIGGLALGVVEALVSNLGADRYHQEVGLLVLLVVLVVQAGGIGALRRARVREAVAR